VDIQSALDSTLRTTLNVLGLKSGWVSMLPESLLGVPPLEDLRSDGFTLAAACGLPPGLERDDRAVLRLPPACSCQRRLKEGRLTRPVNIVECTRLQESTRVGGDTGGLHFHASVPLISKGRPLGLLNAASSKRQFLTQADLHFLSAVGAQLVIALERAHFYEVAEARRVALENELQVAREVQEDLMPREMPDVPGYSYAAAWHPARQVAGDLYKMFPLGQDRWGIMIGDVADKGTAAALHMAVLDSLVLSGSLRHRSPAAVLSEINQTLLRQWAASAMFATVFLGVLDLNDQALTYANAGHNPPIVRRASGTIESLTRTGSALGVFEEPQLTDAAINLRSGDTVMLYTDGVTEAWPAHPGSEQYGLRRLTAAISGGPGEADKLLAHVEADLNAFTGGAAQQDDVTLLVVSKD
jgi:serine phosphatase RsbU (regulator of sigma subunit)